MKKIVPTIFLGTSLLTTVSLSHAVDFDVQVENLTRGLYFTPLLMTAHPAGTSIFTLGQPADEGGALQAMAEGGQTAGLADIITTSGGIVADSTPPVGPGGSTTASLNTDASTANTQFTLAGMILPSNDGFVALNGITIPSTPGTYVYYANAYDAGTEANDEIVTLDNSGGAPNAAGFPLGPVPAESLGTGATGVTTQIEGFVHIHRGNLGDTESDNGISDIDSTVHRWLNPVAKVTITVN